MNEILLAFTCVERRVDRFNFDFALRSDSLSFCEVGWVGGVGCWQELENINFIFNPKNLLFSNGDKWRVDDWRW